MLYIKFWPDILFGPIGPEGIILYCGLVSMVFYPKCENIMLSLTGSVFSAPDQMRSPK